MVTMKHAVMSDDGTAEYTCPECGRTLVLRPDRPVRESTPVRVRVQCACSRTHVVLVERRLHVRKEVNLPGLWSLPGEQPSHRMVVQNLSRTGMLLRLGDIGVIDIDDRILVEFALGAPQLITFRKEVVVRRSLGFSVGAEFAPGSNGDAYDPIYDLALAQHPTDHSSAMVP